MSAQELAVEVPSHAGDVLGRRAASRSEPVSKLAKASPLELARVPR